MAEAKKSGVVVHDLVNWRTPIDGTNPPKYRHGTALRGEQVDIPESEFARLEALGAVAAPEQAAVAQEARDAADRPFPEGQDGDVQLSLLSAEDLIAYVGQFPDEQQRVARIEQARRGGARVTVLRAAGVETPEA